MIYIPEHRFLISLILLFLSLYSFKDLISGRAFFNSNIRLTVNDYLPFIITVTLYSVFAYAEGDFYHYADNYELELHSLAPVYVEPFYYWLIHNLPGGYYCWRLAIWGSAAIIFAIVFKRLELQINIAAAIFAVYYLWTFTVSRESLGIAMLFLGVTFWIKPTNKKIISYLIGIGLIVLSFPLHRSILLSIIPFLFSFVRLSKSRFVIILLLIGVISSLMTYGLTYFAEGNNIGIGDDLSIFEQAAIYANAEKVNITFYGIINEIIRLGGLCFAMCFMLREYTFNKKQLPQEYSPFLMYWFILFIVSAILYTMDASRFLSSRMLSKGLPAMVIVLTYYYQTNPITKKGKILLLSLLAYPIYTILFYMYTR